MGFNNGISTEEYIKRNSGEYENYKKWYWNDETTHGKAESMRYEANDIINNYIIPALRKMHAEFDKDRVSFENETVRVEGNEDGFIVIDLRNGKVGFHTDRKRYPDIRLKDYKYDGNTISKMITNG